MTGLELNPPAKRLLTKQDFKIFQTETKQVNALIFFGLEVPHYARTRYDNLLLIPRLVPITKTNQITIDYGAIFAKTFEGISLRGAGFPPKQKENSRSKLTVS